MTVQAQDSVQYYDGPINVGTVISITDFTFIDNSHISMKIRNVDGIWEYGVDYTVDGAGTLERTATILREVEAGQTLAVYLDVPITQNISPEEGGNFPASTNEFVLDKLTYICQMLYERVARSMQVSIDNPFDGTLSVLVPGKAIKINAAGNGLELSDLDPDKAVEEIQRYIEIAEAAAEAAEQSKDTAQEIVDKLNVTKEQVDAAAEAAIEASEEAIERVDRAEKYKLNSKEIGSLLFSSVPNYSTDLHIADGAKITSEDACWAELHNIWAKQKRESTDIKTNFYKYASTNYSRMWYSTVQSTPDQYYNLQNVLNIPQGEVYLFDRAGKAHLRASLSVQSYYKYELLNAVGDTSPNQYLLFPIQMGNEQLFEPTNANKDDFYIYVNDYKVGAHYDNITHLDILPPDVTSEYRRILLTREVAGNTYYYYYKAAPIKIQAYMIGSVADLNLGGQAGVQTQDTVPRPILITTPVETFVVTTNTEFLTTAEFDANQLKHDEFYTNIVNKSTDTTYQIAALTKDFRTYSRNTAVTCPLANALGWVDGFYSWYYKIPFNASTGTQLDPTGNIVAIPLKTLDIEVKIQTAYNGNYQRIIWGDRDTVDVAGPIQLGIVENGRAQEDGHGTQNRFEWLIPNADFNGWAIVLRIPYELKEYTKYRTKFILDEEGYYHVYFAEEDDEYEEVFTGVCPTIYINTYSDMQLGAAYKDEWCHFRGKIDMKNTHFRVNNIDKIAESLKYYAKETETTWFTPYTSNDRPKLVEKPFANVYETNPTGFSLVNLIEDIDGWCAPTAANCGHWYGTGDNSAWISHEADNYIDIQGRFMTQSTWSAYNTMFQIMRQGYGINPFRLCHQANNREAQICMGHNGTAWNITETNTGIQLLDNTEYFIRWYSDFSKKYSLTDDTWTEDEAGTNYKYTLTLRPWNGPEDDAEEYTWDYYTTYKFGSASNDHYAWGGIGYDNYTLGCPSFFNVYATSVNGKVAWADNIHVVPRQEDSTIIPNIPTENSETENYVVVANGITEDIILATPQEQLNNYTQQLLQQLTDKQNQIIALITQQSQDIATETAQGIARLISASDAITHSEVVPVYPIIQSYYDEDTGSFYHIFARNEHGYYCIQGGMFGTHDTNYRDIYVNFFKRFKDCKYQAFAIQSNPDDVQYAGVWDKQQHTCMFGQVYNNQGFATWFAMGYLLDTEVTE